MKYLDFDIELKSISPKKQLARPKVFTNDLDSVMIRITIKDMTDTDLLGSSAEMLLYMQDRSFFQNADVTREGNVFKYLLKENEGNHSGIARFQLPVTTAGGKVYAQQKLEFEIVSGLETTVATEVMIQDWTTLTREARDYLDEAIPNEQTRTDNESARVEAELLRAQDAEDFAEAEVLRVQAEALRAEAESLRVTAENLREQNEATRQTTFNKSQVDRQAAYETAEDIRDGLYNQAEENRDLRVAAIESRQIVTDSNGNKFFISLEIHEGKPRLKLEEVN